MRICVITSADFPPEEGIGNYIYNMSKEFIRKGHDVTVVTRGNFQKTHLEYYDEIKIYRVPFIFIYPFHVHLHGIFVNKLFKSIENNFDVIHVHSPLPPLVKSKVPVLLTIHSPMKSGASVLEITDLFSLATKFQSKYISYPLERKLITNSLMVTAVSSTVSKDLSCYGLKAEDIKLVYNGVDQNIFFPSGTKPKEKSILYTGRISYGKGLVELIDCAKEVCEIRDDVSFVFAGDGPLLSNLKKKVLDMNLQNQIKFLGRVNRKTIINLYQNATIFAFPSYYEGLPGSLLEAMACQLPIVATEVPGNIELIEHNRNGILIPPKNASAISKAILELLDDPDKREKLGNNARKTIEDKFTWNAISDRILNCYKSIL
ncbi:Glycosyltransferase [Methanosarcina siciliae HI350]|uniref:Glycosyltransferase n=1 Tax=Methanosarcina siciliae HI350 TaxID=1434119 RepID=A0A0E3LB31_9EURY|nr:glycosyltransferase family 4 protein [Methanosarcina siciliae]AKB33061.1 Glycosyltransferase [Methanosarcina siciliae HI350]